MKKITAILVLIVAVAFAGFAVADTVKAALKAGDEVYVCGCGAACKCGSMAKKPAKCTCNKDMVKATVTKVEGEKATLMVNGKEQTFATTAKYECGCGAGCNCGYVSQKPGKCACGKELKAVK